MEKIQKAAKPKLCYVLLAEPGDQSLWRQMEIQLFTRIGSNAGSSSCLAVDQTTGRELKGWGTQ